MVIDALTVVVPEPTGAIFDAVEEPVSCTTRACPEVTLTINERPTVMGVCSLFTLIPT